MLAFTKVFAVAGFLLPFARAADCTGRLCSLEDETSLVQVKQVVTQGSERPEKDLEAVELLKRDAIEELVDTASVAATKQAEEEIKQQNKDEDPIWAFEPFEMIPRMDPKLDAAEVGANAYIDAQTGAVDAGQVSSALFSNMDKARRQVVTRVGDDLEFQDAIRSKRLADNNATEVSIEADKRAVAASIEKDHARVRAAMNRRIAVQKAAHKKMEKAKEAWEAHAYKKKQAAAAAVAGKLQGKEEGYDEAARRMDEWENSVIEAAADRRHAAKTAAVVGTVARERAAVGRGTIIKDAAEAAMYLD